MQSLKTLLDISKNKLINKSDKDLIGNCHNRDSYGSTITRKK